MIFPVVEAYAEAPELALDLVDGLLLTGGRDLDAGSLRRRGPPGQRGRRPASRPARARARPAGARARAARCSASAGACRCSTSRSAAASTSTSTIPSGSTAASPGTFVGHGRGRRRHAAAAILGERRRPVRSHHHQGVDAARRAPHGVGARRRRPRRGRRDRRPRLLPRRALAPGGGSRGRRPAPLRGPRRRRGRSGRSRAVRRMSATPQRDGEPLRADPSKIVATHLSYRSRCDEYRMAAPPRVPVLLPQAAELGLRPRGRGCAPARLSLPQLRGRDRARDRQARARRLEAEALDHVAGYTVANDFGVHDFRHIDRGSMLRVKGQDGFCPLGPATRRRRRRRPRGPHRAHVRQRRAGAGGPQRRPTSSSRSPTRSPTSRG